MRVPDDAELLELWDQGCNRHPIDRALLLAGRAREDLAPGQVAELPIGAVNAAVLRFRAACFGRLIDAWLDCERCGEAMELSLDTEELLAGAVEDDPIPHVERSGFRFRAPDSRDLAALVREPDPGGAALALLERCCVARAPGATADRAGLLAEVEAAFEAADPTSSIDLALTCPVCAHRWTAPLHVAELVWDEVDGHARRLLGCVHALARAYGWTESEVLTMSPRRRAAYLEMVGA